MAICGAEPEKVVESSKKSGISGSGEAAEGLVNLSKHIDEPGSSVEETLADLLKKVGDSYNPKKKRTPKTPGTARANKKRKAASSETTKTPLPKGRAMRSKLKQSEEELEKAMKAKTSSKTSSFASKSVGPSTLAKWTRSAVKAKQVKITNKKDWSGEEEDKSDTE
ncbi:uncharacterized protein [Nicotiana sylvestris]|uniref:uncharacterized protein n=1 Tax=Nicotiana sylvestris TaxID=4096 RepID=UPI00388CBB04